MSFGNGVRIAFVHLGWHSASNTGEKGARNVTVASFRKTPLKGIFFPKTG